MKLAVTGFVSEEAGSVASANALLLRQLLIRGHGIDFFSKPAFVDPRPAVGEHAAFRFVPVVNGLSDGFRRGVDKVPLLNEAARRNDSACYNRLLVRRIREEHERRTYDLVLWMGDYAQNGVGGVRTVSFAQGPPGTDARSILTRRKEIIKLTGVLKAARLMALARLRLSSAGLPKLRCSDHFIIGSRQSAQTMERLYKVRAGKISVLPYPIDLDLFKPSSQFRPPASGIRVLWLGRIIPRKRLDVFLDGAALAIKQSVVLQLTLVGSVGLVPGYEKLIEAFQDIHPGRLEWRKQIARGDVPSLMQQHDLLCQPSDEENFGSSVAEAQACGLPVIVGQTNGNADYLCSRDIHLADDKPETLAKAFAELARRKQQNQWGDPAESRALAGKHFDINGVTDRLVTILEGVKGA